MFFTKIYFGKDDIINFKNGEIVLPTVRKIAEAYSELAYIKKGMEKAHIQYGDCWYDFYNNFPVLPIKSDPTSIDGDGDGIDDINDSKPLVNDISTGIWLKSDEQYNTVVQAELLKLHLSWLLATNDVDKKF